MPYTRSRRKRNSNSDNYPVKSQKIVSSEEDSEDMGYNSGDIEELSGEYSEHSEHSEHSEYSKYKKENSFLEYLKNNIPGLENFSEEDVKNILGQILSKYYDEIKNNLESDIISKDEYDNLIMEKKRIRNMINERQPTLLKILNSKISDESKCEALRLYDIYLNTESYTLEKKDIEAYIDEIVGLSNNNDEERNEILKEESSLKSKYPSKDLSFKRSIYNLNTSEEIKAKLYHLNDELMNMDRSNSEYTMLKNKLFWFVNLPYKNIFNPFNVKTISELKTFCKNVYISLDYYLHGMYEVKEQVMKTIVNRACNHLNGNKNFKSQLGLSSPPGRGKTAVAEAIAKSLNLPFERISLGGIDDPSILKGTDNSWIGSSPSIILQILSRQKISNGIILFDELDKLSQSSRGKDVENALIHITDYTQNHEFQDLYLSDYNHDLSNIWFMFAMNNEYKISSILRDRLNIIHIYSYSKDDVVSIIKRHFLPKALENAGLNKEDISLTTLACKKVYDLLFKDIENEGLRCVQREVEDIVSKLNLLRVLKSNEKRDYIKISYNLHHFTNFPYTVKKSDVEKLTNLSKNENDFMSMYL